jgi:translation initiation factor IF-1
MANKEDVLEVEGVVRELLPNMTFVVKLDNGIEIKAHLCGKMRMRNIRVLVGDHVKIEMSSYDLTKGRIIYRGKR